MRCLDALFPKVFLSTCRSRSDIRVACALWHHVAIQCWSLLNCGTVHPATSRPLNRDGSLMRFLPDLIWDVRSRVRSGGISRNTKRGVVASCSCFDALVVLCTCHCCMAGSDTLRTGNRPRRFRCLVVVRTASCRIPCTMGIDIPCNARPLRGRRRVQYIFSKVPRCTLLQLCASCTSRIGIVCQAEDSVLASSI